MVILGLVVMVLMFDEMKSVMLGPGFTPPAAASNRQNRVPAASGSDES
jgi:hypothetical protein